MKLNKIFIAGSMLAASLSLGSCVGDLNQEPTDPNKVTDLTTYDEFTGLVMRAYGGLVMEGGISVDDGGAGVYTRQLFNQQELTTDECVICMNWNDVGLDELIYALPSPDNHWIYEMYSRITFQINLCNNVINNLHTDAAKKAFEEAGQSQLIEQYVNEMRVLRALSYYHMIDIFGKGSFTDENSEIGVIPPTYTRQELFDWTVNDLKSAIPNVLPAAQQQYGRLSREAAYALLAKLYLNAEVYTGKPMWQECANACQEITKTLPGLAPTYKYLFCGSNDKYVACSSNNLSTAEIIWSVPQNQTTMQTYGGTTYLSGGSYATSSPVARWGLNGTPWQGPHMRPETVNNFTDPADTRALFWAGDFTNDLLDLSTWGEAGDSGYQCVKFVYTDEDHYELSDNAGDDGNPDKPYLSLDIFCNADFPLFRLADIYLMLAECQLNGVSCDGLNYYNKVRERAGVTPVGYYSAQDLLDERNRELYWECHRRSDLIRFGKYTGGSYNWQWKGAVQAGGPLDSYRDLMPIPSQFTPTLGQNPGY